MTTIILDIQNCKVYSDSRGTETDTKLIREGFRFKNKEVYNFYDDTQKIFRTNNHIVTGSGSLALLEAIVDMVVGGCYHIPDCLYTRNKYDLGKTTVVICRKHGESLTGVKVQLTPKRILGTRFIKVDITKSKIKSSERFMTLGSGREFAIGALRAESTPEKAMDIAKEFDKYSGGETIVVSL